MRGRETRAQRVGGRETRAQRGFRRLFLEPLEERSLLAAIIVTSLSDGTLASLAGDGEISLREAIEAANTNKSVDGSTAGTAGIDLIVFQPGLAGTISLVAGELAISETLVIQGRGADATILDAHGASRVFEITAGAGDVTLDRLTIVNGHVNDANGGGILSNSPGTLAVSNVNIVGNSVLNPGVNAEGGGIYALGALTVVNSTIRGNSVSNGSDSHHVSAQGGGVSASGPITITSSTISNNAVSASFADVMFAGGGGVRGGGSVTIIDSTISGNSATAGGLNSGAHGGGIEADLEATIRNSTVSGNFVTTSGFGDEADGGGVYAFSLTVEQSTIAFNSVAGEGSYGGGLFSRSKGTIRDSIVAKNTDTKDDASHPDLRIGNFTSTLAVVQTSLIGDNSGTSLPASATPDANGNIVGGAGAAAIDPLLGPLTNNGGRTPTHALLAGSPALDHGKISHSAAILATPDLRAYYRLNETSLTTAADSSGHGLDGSYVNGVLLGTANSLVTGDGGNTLGTTAKFDGSNDQVTLPTSIVPAGGFTDFSLSFWVNTTQASAPGDTWKLGDGLVDGSKNLDGADFGTSQLNGKFAFGVGSPDTTVQSIVPINDGQWHYVVATRVSSTGAMAVYVDGALDNTGMGPTGPRSSITRLVMGSMQPNFSFFAGQLDDVAIFTRALDAGEVASIYQAEVPPAHDQREFSRVSGARDYGAYERQSLGALALVVDTTVDESDGNYGTGDLSLREAIGLANGSVGANSITFSPAINGQLILLTQGQLEISDSVTIQGNGAANTIIDGQQQSRVFDVLATGGDVTFEGVTVRNGKTTGDAIRNGGGGIYSESPGTLTVQNSIVSGNATLGNSASGGAILAFGDVAVTGSMISNNSTAGFGGGIRSQGSGSVTVTGSTLSDNIGSGISTNGGSVSVISSTISGNSATDGGGIAGGALAIINSTISGNRATGDGGGLYSPVTANAILVMNSTISGNSAGKNGGGIAGSSVSFTLRNSIVAGNRDTGDGSNPDLDQFLFGDSQFSLIGDNNGTFINPAPVGLPDANGNLIGTHAAPIDPNLAPLADNGGPTQTMALLPGSPAMDAGDPQSPQLITPISVVSKTDATDFWKATRLIDGSGLVDGSSNAASATINNYTTVTQSQTQDTAWVTDAFFPDYYTGGGTIPELKFNLGGTFSLSSIVVWGYNPFGVNNNEAKDLEVSFSTDGGTNFGSPITLRHARTAAAAETLEFGGIHSANAVKIRVLSNYNGAPGAAGGDRVGLGEIRFLTGPGSDQRGYPYRRRIDGDRNGSVRQDMGAYEYNTLVVTTKDDENDATYNAADLSLREAIAISNNSPGLDDITFAPALNGQTITLNQGELSVNDSVTIRGPGADKVSISGGSGETQSRIFSFHPSEFGTPYRLSGLTLRDGNGLGFDNGFGGAIYVNGCNLTVTDSVIRDSTSLAITGNQQGGGVFAAFATLKMSNVTLANNTAEYGGGLSVQDGDAALTNVTISGNTANSTSGGIDYFDTSVGATFRLLLINSTVTANKSQVAAGIGNATLSNAVSSTVTLGNSIVANNIGGGTQFTNGGVGAAVVSLGHNISSDASGNLTGPGDLQNIDPHLAPLSQYEGPLPTHVLCEGVDNPIFGCGGRSPAIDAGDNALAKTAGPDGVWGNADDVPLVTDARGLPFQRIVNGTVDIGAFEYFLNHNPTCDVKLLLPPIDDEQGLVTIPNFVSNCTANDPLQTVTITIDTTRPDFFTVPPSLDAAGTLTYDPAPNVHGDFQLSITVHDDGGRLHGTDSYGYLTHAPIEKKHRLFNAAETGERRGLDVTGSTSTAPDGFIVAQDVVAVINYINANHSGKIPDSGPYGPPYVDVNGDDNVVAEDVLDIINWINAHPRQAEAEVTVESQPETNNLPDDLISLLSLDIAEQAARRRRVTFRKE